MAISMIATVMSIFTYLLSNQVSPGEGKGTQFQYSCLGNPMSRGAWQAAAHGVTASNTTE